MTWAIEQFRPVAPLGYKLCQSCAGLIRLTDRHASCQKCRKAGGYIRWPGVAA